MRVTILGVSIFNPVVTIGAEVGPLKSEEEIISPRGGWFESDNRRFGKITLLYLPRRPHRFAKCQGHSSEIFLLI